MRPLRMTTAKASSPSGACSVNFEILAANSGTVSLVSKTPGVSKQRNLCPLPATYSNELTSLVIDSKSSSARNFSEADSELAVECCWSFAMPSLAN